MSSMQQDYQLVADYASDRSETAFRSLVARHVDMVYATALRHIGDRALAEEITQNVFVALARKAPGLGRMRTIAGWLHSTAILESKARLRAELRRRRPEEAAAQIAALEREGTSPLEMLIPLLDEALLCLSESDRVALVLRFFEDRSLREVGEILGLNEDAARKRVSRALERLAKFFPQRGLALPAGVTTVAVLGSATQAAPAALIGSATSAGLSTGGASGFNLLLFRLMNLSKTQTAAACALTCAVPLAWQSHIHHGLTRQQVEVSSQIAASRKEANELEFEASRLRDEVAQAQEDAATAQARSDKIAEQLDGRLRPAVYHWDESSPLMRVPKKALRNLAPWNLRSVVDRTGKISDTMKDMLQMTDEEAKRLQDGIDSFLASYTALEAQHLRPVAPEEDDLRGQKPEQVRVFDVSGLVPEYNKLSQTLFDEIDAVLDPEQADIFKNGLHTWMQFNDEHSSQMTSSSQVAFDTDYRVRFYQPKPGDRWIQCDTEFFSSSGAHDGEIGFSVKPNEVPANYQGYLQDWTSMLSETQANNGPASGAQ
jgi:RNA polymerase sigma factor (sigma-70 family)